MKPANNNMDKPILIHCLNVGEFQVNTYVAACAKTLEALIIDPGGEDDKIIRTVQDNHFKPRMIVNTHGHRDHVAGNDRLSRHFGVPVAMHEEDKLFYKAKNLCIDMDLHHGDILSVGELKIKVIHTPGHTPGSICLLTENRLFSGDTLFVGDAGRTDLPGGHLPTLIRSIREKIITLPPETLLHPGHDYGITPYSTIGREIQENIYITDFIHP